MHAPFPPPSTSEAPGQARTKTTPPTPTPPRAGCPETDLATSASDIARRPPAARSAAAAMAIAASIHNNDKFQESHSWLAITQYSRNRPRRHSPIPVGRWVGGSVGRWVGGSVGSVGRRPKPQPLSRTLSRTLSKRLPPHGNLPNWAGVDRADRGDHIVNAVNNVNVVNKVPPSSPHRRLHPSPHQPEQRRCHRARPITASQHSHFAEHPT